MNFVSDDVAEQTKQVWKSFTCNLNSKSLYNNNDDDGDSDGDNDGDGDDDSDGDGDGDDDDDDDNWKTVTCQQCRESFASRH